MAVAQVNREDFNLTTKQQTFQFKIQLRVLFEGSSEPLDLSNLVTNLLVTNDYKTNMFPVVRARLVMPETIRKKLHAGYRKAKFILNVDQHTVDSTDATVSDSFTNSIKNEAMMCMDLETIPNRKSITEEDTDDSGISNADSLILNLDLISLEHININKKLFSRSFINTNISSVVGWLINQIPTSRKYIINKFDNQSVLEEVYFPPLNFRNTIHYLQNYFKIFRSGFKMFFGYDYNFILNYNNSFIDFKPNKRFKKVYIEILAGRNNTGFTTNTSWTYIEKSLHWIRTSSNVYTHKPVVMENELNGEKADINSYPDSDYFFKNKGNDITGGEGNNGNSPKEKFLWRHTDNDWLDAEKKRIHSDSKNTIKLEFFDVNLEFLSPDRSFYFNFNDEDLNNLQAEYGLNKVIHEFVKSNGSVYSRCTSHAYFTKNNNF